MKIVFLLFQIVALSILSSCQISHETSPTSFMGFKDQIVYVKEFPQTFTLSGETVPDIDIIGIQDIQICDTMIIFSEKDKRIFGLVIPYPDTIIWVAC